jgi:hypothetical protein
MISLWISGQSKAEDKTTGEDEVGTERKGEQKDHLHGNSRKK